MGWPFLMPETVSEKSAAKVGIVARAKSRATGVARAAKDFMAVP